MQTDRQRGSAGFSLVELMVVVLVLGVLLAIAVPKFYGAQERARVRTAQANLRSAEVLMSSVYAEKAGYAPIDLTLLTKSDPNLFPPADTVATPSAGPGFISWAYAHGATTTTDPVGADGFVMAARSSDGRCFLLLVGSSGRLFGQLAAPLAGDCVATAAPTVNSTSQLAWGADDVVQWH